MIEGQESFIRVRLLRRRDILGEEFWECETLTQDGEVASDGFSTFAKASEFVIPHKCKRAAKRPLAGAGVDPSGSDKPVIATDDASGEGAGSSPVRERESGPGVVRAGPGMGGPDEGWGEIGDTGTGRVGGDEGLRGGAGAGDVDRNRPSDPGKRDDGRTSAGNPWDF